MSYIATFFWTALYDFVIYINKLATSLKKMNWKKFNLFGNTKKTAQLLMLENLNLRKLKFLKVYQKNNGNQLTTNLIK